MKNLIFLFVILFSGLLSASVISGEVVIDKALEKQLPKGGALYVFARSAEGEKGFPLAVKRYENPKFPQTFTLSQKDSMVSGTEFKGAIKIIARFSPTGDVMAKTGAFEGVVGQDKKIVVGKTKNVKVLIDTALKEQ